MGSFRPDLKTPNKMAEPQTRENLAQNPLSRSPFAADLDTGDRLPAPPAVTADSDDVGVGDPDLIREPKRRKHCPMALENLDELTSASNSSFGFTFDTKFCGFAAAEVTPKFGSFNSIAPEIERKKKEQSSVLDSASEVRGDEEDKGEAVQQEEDEEEEEEIEAGDALREAIGEGGGNLESVAD